MKVHPNLLNLRAKVKYLIYRHRDFSHFKIMKNVILKGNYDKEYRFDYILINEHDNYTIGIIIKDWQRSCGYQVIFRAEKIVEATGLDSMIIFGKSFSETAKSWAKKLRILILSDGDLGSLINSRLTTEVIKR